MNRLLCIFGLLFSVSCFGETQAPATVSLKSGTILRDVVVLKWETNRVIVKHRGGTDPVQFVHMADESRKAFDAAKEENLKVEAEKRKQAAAPKTFYGEIFVATNGRETVRLSDAVVVAFPLAEALHEFDGYRTPNLPSPVARALTDSSGKFTLVVPAEALPVMIRVIESRLVGKTRERYEWRIESDKIPDPANVILSNSNMR